MRGLRGRLHQRCNQQLRLAARWRSRPAGRPGLCSPRAPPGGRKAAPRAGARRRRAARAPLLFNRDSAKPPTSSNPTAGCNSRSSAATSASASGGQNALSVWVWAFPRARRPRARWAKRACHSRPPCSRGTTPSSPSKFQLGARALPFLPHPLPRAALPQASPCPSRLNPGLPDSPARSDEQLSRLGSGAPPAALAPPGDLRA